MSQLKTFKCPSCGGYLEFDPNAQQFSCPYCGQSLTHDQVLQLSGEKVQETKAEKKPEAHYCTYHCRSCGAEIVTDETTAATRCYYCHSPVILSDRLEGTFHPDGVIPFKIGREQAIEQFKAYIARKKFVDRKFFSEDQMEMFSGVYYPYWLGDIEGEASFSGIGTKSSIAHHRDVTITTTSFFQVNKTGRLTFTELMRKALKKADSLLLGGIHPFTLQDLQAFSPAYLSGFLAEKRDIESNEVSGEMLQEVREKAKKMIRNQDNHFETLKGEAGFSATSQKMRYVLLPVWLLTYRSNKPGEGFFYMMNGQTGKVCGKLPVDRKRLLLSAAGICAAVTALLCLGGALIW